MQTKINNKELGFLGENIAGKFLESSGYIILDRNYSKSFGEIDLIAQKDDCVSFVEVKTNQSTVSKIFSPELRVDRKKIAHISKVANIYLESKGWLGIKEWQIDIVSVIISTDDKKAQVKHLKNIASDIY